MQRGLTSTVALFSFPVVMLFAAVPAHAATARATALSFPANGTVSGIYVHSGEKVTQGQILMALDTSDLLIQLDEAQAGADYQQIKLSQLYQTSVSSSTTTANDPVSLARQNLISTLQDGYVKAEDAVRNRADQIFSGVPGGQPQVTFQNVDPSAAGQIASQDVAIEALLTSWKSSIDNVGTGDLHALADASIANLTTIKTFLDSVAQFVNFARPDVVNTQTILKTIRNDVYTGRVEELSGLTEAISARSRLRDAQLAADNATASIQLQQDVVRQANDKVKEIQNSIDRMTLRAPEAGTVTRISVALGTSVYARLPVLYVRPLPAKLSLFGSISAQMASALSAFSSFFVLR